MRAIGAESGEGSGGMFTSVLLGRCFRDGVCVCVCVWWGGVRLFFLKAMGGVLGRTSGGVDGGGKNEIFGESGGCVVLHCPLSARLVFILSEGLIKHEKECEPGTLGTSEPLLKWLLFGLAV